MVAIRGLAALHPGWWGSRPCALEHGAVSYHRVPTRPQGQASACSRMGPHIVHWDQYLCSKSHLFHLEIWGKQSCFLVLYFLKHPNSNSPQCVVIRS